MGGFVQYDSVFVTTKTGIHDRHEGEGGDREGIGLMWSEDVVLRMEGEEWKKRDL